MRQRVEFAFQVAEVDKTQLGDIAVAVAVVLVSVLEDEATIAIFRLWCVAEGPMSVGVAV